MRAGHRRPGGQAARNILCGKGFRPVAGALAAGKCAQLSHRSLQSGGSSPECRGCRSLRGVLARFFLARPPPASPPGRKPASRSGSSRFPPPSRRFGPTPWSRRARRRGWIERFGPGNPGNVAARGRLVAAATTGVAVFAAFLISGGKPAAPTARDRHQSWPSMSDGSGRPRRRRCRWAGVDLALVVCSSTGSHGKRRAGNAAFRPRSDQRRPLSSCRRMLTAGLAESQQPRECPAATRVVWPGGRDQHRAANIHSLSGHPA